MCVCAPPQCYFAATERKWHLHGKDGRIALPPSLLLAYSFLCILHLSFFLSHSLYIAHGSADITAFLVCGNLGLDLLSSLFFNIPQPFSPRQHFIAVIAGGNFSFNSMFLQALRFSFHAAHSCSIFSAIIMTLFPNSGLRFGVFEVTFGSREQLKMSQIL